MNIFLHVKQWNLKYFRLFFFSIGLFFCVHFTASAFTFGNQSVNGGFGLVLSNDTPMLMSLMNPENNLNFKVLNQTNVDIWTLLNVSDAFHWFVEAGAYLYYNNYGSIDNVPNYTYRNYFVTAQGYLLQKNLSIWGHLTRFWMMGNIPMGSSGVFSYQVGRFPTSDISQFILSNSLLDGLTLGFNWPYFFITLYSGYSGLIDKYDSKIRVTSYDRDIYEDPQVYFAAPRVISKLDLGIPFFDQTFTVEAMYEKDLLPLMNPDKVIQDNTSTLSAPLDSTGAVDLIFADVQLAGYAGGVFHYSLGGNVSLGKLLTEYEKQYQYIWNLGYLAYAQFDLYFGSNQSNIITFSGVYISGNSQAVMENSGTDKIKLNIPQNMLHQFVSLSPPQLAFIFSPLDLNNLSMANLGYTYAMLNKMVTFSVVGHGFFRGSAGPIGAKTAAIDYNKLGISYLGTELDLSLEVQPIDSLLFRLETGVWLPFENQAYTASLEIPDGSHLQLGIRFFCAYTI